MNLTASVVLATALLVPLRVVAIQTTNEIAVACKAVSAESPPAAARSAGTFAAGYECYCAFTQSSTICNIAVTVSSQDSLKCDATLPYDRLEIRYSRPLTNIGVRWTLVPKDPRTDLNEYAFGPKPSILLVQQGNFLDGASGGFLSSEREDRYRFVWMAKAIPKSAEFTGMHLPVVLRKRAADGYLNICQPADPPIINTGY